MLIRNLFVLDVTRDIPPVVYFHEQTSEKLATEVNEYIITGGWPDTHPNHRRVPDGIHEQYVRLLNNIVAELNKAGGVDLPNIWISGFYGSGKSSFAKLLGMALNGVALPNSKSLADAWLARDTSPKAGDLRDAWKKLRTKIDHPISVVFDIGGFARDNEQIHAAAMRQVQKRLGYCVTDPIVADFELKLERDGEWARFQKVALQKLGKPWNDSKEKSLAEEDFSLIMSEMFPDHYPDSMAWYASRAGTHQRTQSPEEAVEAIGDMLKFRQPDATLFMVIDEVSQYVRGAQDRVDRLRAFASALGAKLKGKAWLLGLGQQKIDEDAGDVFLTWAKDRFPPKLRVHLAPTNIRDVVHKRLLQKTTEAEATLKKLFEKHRPDLKLFAYGCETITAEDFIETYPMLPGHIELLLQLTSALRVRSARAQGDDQAIRGLLQLLGELFRSQKLADEPVGALVTLDKIYEVQHTALGSDVQSSMARVLSHCADDTKGLKIRAAKAVALLELIQESLPTDAKLVSQCLFDRIDRGSQLEEVTEALEELRRQNLLGYSEKQGYKIQSTAGEEWERERREISIGRKETCEIIQESLKLLLSDAEKPKLHARPFPWAAVFSDGRQYNDSALLDPHDDAAVRIDFRFVSHEERVDSVWIKRSDESALQNRLVWVCGDTDELDSTVREFARSRDMITKYKPRSQSLTPDRRTLLSQEEGRKEELEKVVKAQIARTWMAGRIYFRSRALSPKEHGGALGTALTAAANRLLPDLFPHFVNLLITPAEMLQLVESDLSGPSPKFLSEELWILDLDAGRYVATCNGVIPKRIQASVEKLDGVSGSALISEFGGPPYGYTSDLIKACVAGLLRASKIKIKPESGQEITAPRDAGSRDVFEKDRSFRRAEFFPAGDDDIGFPARARICKFFQDQLSCAVDREDNAIADAVTLYFPLQADRLKDVLTRLNQLPNSPATPKELVKLATAIEQCVRSARHTKPTVKLVKKSLDGLRDGIQLLNIISAELTAETIQSVREASDVLSYQVQQLRELGVLTAETEMAADRVQKQLSLERPWREIRSLDGDLQLLRDSYTVQRKQILQWQEEQSEQARSRLKGRDGFSTLTADQSHQVLRPLTKATTDTTDSAIAPALVMLKDPVVMALKRAEDEASDILDGLRSQGPVSLVVKMDTNLRNREVATEAEVEALIAELRERLMQQIRNGSRVRLQ
jgi:hypothetical protein